MADIEKLKQRIISAGYDGIYNAAGGCGCPVDEMEPGDECNALHCRWTHVTKCVPSEDCNENCIGHQYPGENCYAPKKQKEG